MSTTIAIHWTEPTLQYVVVQGSGAATVGEFSLDIRQEPALVGRQLSEAIAPFLQGRVKLIVALSRGALQWQHLSLPPCPADELPDVVRLQADHDLHSSDEDLGFDFLPLVGDEQTPYQVLTVALAASELAKIRQVFRAANVTLERIVPLAAGWPALTKQIAHDVKPQTHIFVAPSFHASAVNEATLWATRAERVVLLRQFQLAAADDTADSVSAIGSELRRTLLALSEHAEGAELTISLVGHQQAQLAELASTLDAQLEVPVQLLDVTARHPSLSAEASTATPPLALAALAIDEARGQAPLVDLLHPHRRPQAQVNLRTYALAAAAGVLLVTLFGWFSYMKLQAPLNQAAKDQAELTLLKQPLEKLQEYEQRAGAIRDWSAEAPNLLVHLQQMSQCLRPQALDAEGFSIDQDVVLEKWNIEKRRLTIDALARSSRAVQPLESRLRESGYRPQRGKSEPSPTSKEYPWHFQSTIEITSASDYATPLGGANSSAANAASDAASDAATEAKTEATPEANAETGAEESQS